MSATPVDPPSAEGQASPSGSPAVSGPPDGRTQPAGAGERPQPAGSSPGPSAEPPSGGAARRHRPWGRALAVLAVVLLGALLERSAADSLVAGRAWAWDETMHAELPAVRILLHLERDEVRAAADVIQECDRYPFVYPLCLAAWQHFAGIGEGQARALGLWLFLLPTLLGVGLLARRAVRLGRVRGLAERDVGGVALDAALLAVLAAVASPLARRYAPTLFLEVPSLLTMVLGLHAWLSRRGAATPRAARRWEWVTGAWLLVAFFTKFNYGLMLVAVVGLDGLLELVLGPERRATLRAALRILGPLALACVWWFLLPLPHGGETAAAHRAAFAEFISGNREMPPIPEWLRRVNWLTGVAPHAAVLVLLLALTAYGLTRLAGRTAVTLLIAGACFAVPVLLHPFQLDRFLMPAALVLWVGGGAGAALLLQRSPRAAALMAAVVCAATVTVPNLRCASWAGMPIAPEGTASRVFQEEHIGRTLGMFGPPASGGLRRGSHEHLIDLVAGAAGPDGRIGWLGQSTEMSPAALHLGLLERGGAVTRFLRDAHRPMDATPVPVTDDPGLTGEDLLAFIDGYDHVLVCQSGDLKNRGQRRWIRDRWHEFISEQEGLVRRRLGVVMVDRPVVGPTPVGIDVVVRP